MRLRAAGIVAPEHLSRQSDLFAQWRSRDLLLGQVCGLPFRTEFHRTVTLIGALDYGLADTPPGHYHSLFVARSGDRRDGAGVVETVMRRGRTNSVTP